MKHSSKSKIKKQRNQRFIFGLISAGLFLIAAFLLVYYFWASGYFDPPADYPLPEYTDFTVPSITDISVPTENTSASETSESIPEVTENKGETDSPSYYCPVNFDELKAANPDIIGWIYMIKPNISQPILRSDSSDGFYLNHNVSKKKDKNGSIYVEGSYNGSDFNDPCTVIYGHRMSSGAMFGKLESSLSGLDLDDNPQYIFIFTPKKTRVFRIVATLPRNNRHILYYNNFNKSSDYTKFIKEVYSSSGKQVKIAKNVSKPTSGDKLLILSTCLKKDRTKRFIVVAKEIS